MGLNRARMGLNRVRRTVDRRRLALFAGIGAASMLIATAAGGQQAAAATNNLISNPTCQGGTGGWYPWQSTINRATLSSGTGCQVTASGAVTAFSMDDWPGNAVSAPGGTIYTASAGVAGATTAAIGSPIDIVIRELTPSRGIVWQTSGPAANLDWAGQTITVSARLVNSGDYLDVYIGEFNAGSGDSFYATNISLYASSSSGSSSAPPTVALNADPTLVGSGDSSNIVWSSSNASSCSASGGWSGSKATSGTANTGGIWTATTYTLTCTGPGGTASDSATVYVDGSWQNVTDDQFNTASLPSHWCAYNFAPYRANDGYWLPSHVIVNGDGLLHLIESYQASGPNGPGWYQGAVSLNQGPGCQSPVQPPYASVDQQITVRMRVVSTNGITSHRNLPMRWPSTVPWPSGGEENYYESDGSLGDVWQFFHYGATNQFTYHEFPWNDMTQWHTYRFSRSNYTVKVWIDDMSTPVYVCNAVTSPACNSTTLPATYKYPIFQQECLYAGCSTYPNTSGSEDIQIDWIEVDDP